MRITCTVKNTLLIVLACPLPQKDWATLLHFCYYYHYLLVTNYLAIKLLRYLQFQHLQTLPYWKLLVISFCSLLGSTLLLIEKIYNWSHILVGHQLSCSSLVGNPHWWIPNSLVRTNSSENRRSSSLSLKKLTELHEISNGFTRKDWVGVGFWDEHHLETFP